MMRRVYYLSFLASLLTLLFLRVDASQAQSSSRRGEPNVLSTGYYVVDSDDDAPLPWRPNYFFVDTNYQPSTWSRVSSGPRQFARPGYNFYNPAFTNLDQMDTANNAVAGPIAIGFNFNFYKGNYDSVYISTNGFIGFRPYNEALNGSPNYTTPNAVDLAGSPSSAPPAIIAALWADLDMRVIGDSSRVYVRTSPSQDTFMVNYYNVRLRPGSPNSIPGGSGSDRLFIRKFQIVFTRTDSSIQINYGPFTGAINNFPPTLAWRLFQNNVSIGLVNETRTQSTSVLYKNRWDAINVNCPNCNKNLKQTGQWALKFKRWHNVVRAIQVSYPPRNYEICLGSTITPKAAFKNVDSMTQSFKVRYTIRNVVTGNAVYGREVRLLNVLPGQQIDTIFPNYGTNPNLLSQLGTFRACAIATTFDTADNNIGDRWPFDDTTCVRIFGVRVTAQPFNDGSNTYSTTSLGDIPDQQKWISIGTNVVDGEDATFDPPPPRDEVGFGPKQYKSPVIRLDAQDIEGNRYNGSGVGDTLMSFPINIAGQTQAGLAFDYQRTGKVSYPWLWDYDILYGPEHTVLNIQGGIYRRGDSLTLEFKQPAAPGCNPAANAWDRITSIDGGHDFEFQHFFLNLKDYKFGNATYFTKEFRFRLRLKSKFDGSVFNPPPTDDNDDWYVDNLSVQVPRKPEIEVMWVRAVTPYTKLPASQAVSLPVYVKIANNSSNVAIAFPIRVQVLDQNGETKYWQSVTVNSIKGGTDSVVQMPNWNAAAAGQPGEYTIHAWIDQAGYDSYEEDNGTYTKFTLNIEPNGGLTQEFAYDDATLTPQPGQGNDWPSVTNVIGAGTGFQNRSGSFATKFRLVTKDTVYGVRVYYGNSNQSDDAVRISLLKGTPESCTPGDTVDAQYVKAPVQSILEARRGGNLYNQFWPYYFPKPIVLPGGADAAETRGVYWISVSQLSLDDYMMGADLSRGGGIIRVYDPQTPQIPPLYTSPYGTQYKSEPGGNNGDVSCVWALEVTANSGSWAQWTPSAGWWPTMGGAGNPVDRTNINTAYWNWGGSYTPMIRPLVSRSIMVPVEILSFNGQEHNGAVNLTWQTTFESNSAGFMVERKDANTQDAMWEKVRFVASPSANSNTPRAYQTVDNDVKAGTYNYRLIQTDMDGTERASQTITVAVNAPKTFELAQNYPNPFNPTTDITFTLPTAGETRLVIYNSLGQVVRTLFSGYAEAGSHPARWDAKDDNGNEVAAGTYMYQITSGSYSAMRKMTLAK